MMPWYVAGGVSGIEANASTTHWLGLSTPYCTLPSGLFACSNPDRSAVAAPARRRSTVSADVAPDAEGDPALVRHRGDRHHRRGHGQHAGPGRAEPPRSEQTLGPD